MPRGKYPRKPAQEAVSAVSSPAPDVPPAPVVAPQPRAVAAAPVAAGRRPHRFADHARSRDIDSLGESELRAYAAEIGMSKRDATSLGLERLRAGAKSHLVNHFEALTE